MPPINSRQKGARNERARAAEINELFPGAKARRGQQFSGLEGDDIVHNIDGVHFESKAVEKLNVTAAMAQAERDAKERIPVVLWKKNQQRTMAVVFLEDLPSLAFLLMNHTSLHEPSSKESTVPTVQGDGA